MDPISGLAALYEVLRRKAGSRMESKGRSADAPGDAGRARDGRVEFAELERQIRAKLREQSPGARLSSVSKRWVIASLLCWEFDSRLQNEPKFQALVRSVQDSIDGDAKLRLMFEGVIDQLSR